MYSWAAGQAWLDLKPSFGPIMPGLQPKIFTIDIQPIEVEPQRKKVLQIAVCPENEGNLWVVKKLTYELVELMSELL